MTFENKPNLIFLLFILLPIFITAQKSYRIEKLSDEDGFPNSAPLGIGFQDAQGMIWFSERGSLLRYDGYEAIEYPNQLLQMIDFPVAKCLLSNCASMAQLKNEPYQFLINDGFLVHFDLSSETFLILENEKKEPIELACAPIFNTISGKILLITKDGTLIQYLGNKKVKVISPIGVLKNIEARNIIENKNGDYWIWSYHSKDIFFLNMEDQQFQKFEIEKFHQLTEKNEIVMDDQGNLLYPDFESVWNQPLAKLPLLNNLSEREIFDVRLDNKNNFWFKTVDEFSYQYDFRNKKWVEYNGILMTHFEDECGVVWAEKRNKGVRQIIPKDTFPKSKIGDIDIRNTAKVILTNFSKFDGEKNLIKDIPTMPDAKITIGPNDRFFRFDFALSSFGSAFENQFSYFLEGIEEDWSESDHDHIARYNNVPPGDYIFRVRGKNKSGDWANHQLAIHVEVLQAWYKKWWAVLSYFVFGFLLLRFFVKRREQLFVLEKEKLEREVKKRTAEVVKQKNRAEKSEKFKQRFLANMSHEIRTPMNAVLGMTNLVLETPLSIKQKKYLEAINKSSQNLLVIINDILDLSKLEAGKMELEMIPFNIEDSITQIKDTLRFNAEEKGVKLITIINDDVPRFLMGDPSRLNQILINLAGNAIKFTEKGSVEILVENDTAFEGAIKFRVIDSGIGIPLEKLDLLFQSFQQVDSSTSRKYGGTGLGLTISKTLVELQGGKISMKSELGLGSEFYFFIPYEKATKESFNVLENSKMTDKASLDGIKILVAEDYEYNQIVLRDTLEHLIKNVKIDVAENGKIAIGKLEQNEYDLILMDIHMPEMNGLDACKFIRNEMDKPKKFIPIIAMTANVLSTDIEATKDVGMNEFVPKPFKREELLRVLSQFYYNPNGQQNEHLLNNNSSSINTEINSSKVTDMTFLENFTEGDQVRMNKYIELFLKLAPKNLEKILLALEQNNYIDLAKFSHIMKPQLNYMGMKEARSWAEKIEEYSKERILVEEIPKLVEQLKSHIEKSYEELNEVV